MRKISRAGNRKSRPLSDHTRTQIQRLTDDLSLGFKVNDNKHDKWKCSDAMTQMKTLRSMSAFLSCTSSDLSQHPSVKDLITDMIIALEEILQSNNENIKSIASEVALKLVEFLGHSILQYHISDMALELSRLLSSSPAQVSVCCATALKGIISKLTPGRLERNNQICRVLNESETDVKVVSFLLDFFNNDWPPEYFCEMASLLMAIFWRWPPSRFRVWSNIKFLDGLEAVCGNPVLATISLQMYSSIALCVHGTMKLLERGKALINFMVACMDKSQSHQVRMEAFTLFQHLSRSEKGCSIIMDISGEPIVKHILDAMGEWKSCLRKPSPHEVPLVIEACYSALVTRWAGKHHYFFWKFKIDVVLLELLLRKDHTNKSLTLDEVKTSTFQFLDSDVVLFSRPYVWDILGWIATYCGEDCNHRDASYLDFLIVCACYTATSFMHKEHRQLPNHISHASETEASCKSVCQMIFSPCKFIASRVRHHLSGILSGSDEHLNHVLDALNSVAFRNAITQYDNTRTLINLMILTFYSSFSKYCNVLIKKGAVKVLLSIVEMCLTGSTVNMSRSSIVQHLHKTSETVVCCWNHSDDAESGGEFWEGHNVILFSSLRSISEIISYSNDLLYNSFPQTYVDRLHDICNSSNFSPGSRWYASYILSFFGFYGFESKFGKVMKNVLDKNESFDLILKTTRDQSLKVHIVVLLSRCPSLIPLKQTPEKLPFNLVSEVTSEETFVKKSKQEINLSSHVDYHALIKLLEFVYSGFLQADSNLLKKLKVLSKSCKMWILSEMLSRRKPVWGTVVPIADFTFALGSAGYLYSDIMLEAEEAGETPENCRFCTLPSSHMHVHRVFLLSSCEYLRALLCSGMQDSASTIIKVPVCSEALVKLVQWLYSSTLSKPASGCLWKSMTVNQQFQELYPYIQLAWLSEYWFLRDIRQEIINVVLSRITDNQTLSIKIIQIASKLSQFDILEYAASKLAPSYPNLRDSNDLDALDEKLVDMIRTMYVDLSQKRFH